ncbi:nicotinate-nucleotide--dimethylbenzimidazole phosphoribosyltransferase [Aliiruegeria sabulilitoris]|uniref:nicotinate-nucleotide--dimethylbenzimidazole phosphoribosyltransferase n=1 Tax=Aliiruegeria sabulilitoris TaxID=1510458 RepID=UPI000830C58A|nr:nicotinate-nucleotide--dimethylbenzimidazole phosphoribosyltransferase [Aliiruegeria sabulilitoris]NDR56091.1 nicotinate-nucleotide--dimethylbenzimidazole phosphoribosyltransferase [Pseudoruegeria sp. M32A2M]
MTAKAPFSDLNEIRAALANLPQPDSEALAAAQARNGMLTKPPAALGRLEDLAIWYAGWVGNARPNLENLQGIVFAGNHGVAAKGVSAFPIEVTVQMVANFRAGGAAINQLLTAFGARTDIVELELDCPTADFTEAPAMSEQDLVAAMAAGWEAVDPKAGLVVTGEMGIGNTTSAAAIAAALHGGGGEAWVGRGSGVDDEGLARKRDVVDAGLALHADALSDPLEVLRRLGGREIAAMAGAILAARHHRIPVILDGFICTAAASVLESVTPGALDHTVAGHVSAEGAHSMMLEKIGKVPLLSLGLRLGEGSGAALAIGVLKGAIACHSGMATFGEAGVSGG